MSVYFFVLIGLLSLFTFNGFTSESIGKPHKVTVFFVTVLLATVAGMRYGVGTDYFGYYKRYETFKLASFDVFDEPAIKIIAKIASLLYDDPATMMFLAAFITIGLITFSLYKNSDMYSLSILLYVFLGYWHGCFNGVRQYLATAVLFAGHCFIKERKLLKWCVIVFIASLCHVTAIVGILFYFYPVLKINFKNIILSIGIALIGIRLYDSIFNLIEFLKNDKLDFVGEGSSYLTNSINPLRIAVAWVPVLFFVLFRKHYDTNNDKFHFYMNMTILHAILMTTAMNSTYLGRIEIYTGVYTTITWPLLLSRMESRTKKIVIVVMLLTYALYWMTEISGESLAKFQWVFQR